MKKNDKLITVLGVVILIIAAVGIYYWVDEETKAPAAKLDDIFKISSEFSMRPDAITVSDSCPFYTLVATPIAVNYDKDGNQHIIPLYIEKPGETSDAVTKAEKQIGFKPINEISDLSAKDYSLYIAEKYWKQSDAVILIENNETGYSLGVVATPIASYLGIPIIVTDKIDGDVRKVLETLGVTTSIVCGEIEGYEKSLKFENIDEIIDVSSALILERFGHNIEYITLANPRDAWPPEVLNSEVVLSETGRLKSNALFPSNLIQAIKGMFFEITTFSFVIPDYKYALVKVDFKNLQDPEHIEKFGDDVMIGGSLTGYIRTTATPAKRDANGNIEEDRFYFETLVYDSAGEEYTIALTGIFHVLDSAEFELTITVEELSDPYYPMMNQFSSIAPYLTAYHKGIVFAKPEFAFAPTDDIKLNGKTLPGNTQVMYNPMLIPVINQHVYENIHVSFNNLLSKLKDIDISESVESLKKDCYQNPFYVALFGDTIMLPQYYYRSPHNDPFEHPSRGAYGTNCPSDFIYGNIDPEIYSLLPYETEHLENDLYSDYPEAENIVGRITGWDVQDASALIARTIFYDNIINDLGSWKDNAAILVGAGTEVQRLPIINAIQKILGHDDPMKFSSGEKRFLVKRVKSNFEKGGFNAQSAERGAAQRVGFSTEALREIKKDGILNRLFFPWLKVKVRQGYQNIESFLDPEWWLKSILGDSSELVIGGELEQNSNLIISDSHAIFFEKEHGDVLLNTLGGPLYEIFIRYIPIIPSFRTSLDANGAYSVRDVPEMNMGPSIMLVEGCGSGKIDGFHPTNSLANAYLHAGVNAYISPTTFSAFFGALEPRLNFQGGVGFGIMGYAKAWLDWKLRGEFPDVAFNQFIFEEAILEMAEDDVSMGTALRNAKNLFLPETFWDEFRWKPVLSLPSNLPSDLRESIQDRYEATAKGGLDHHPVEKYCTIFQINLLGDPAFNPYEPVNNG